MKRSENKDLHYLIGLFAASILILTSSSCSFRRDVTPVAIADTPQRIVDDIREPLVNEGCEPEDCLSSAVSLRKAGKSAEAQTRLNEILDKFPGTVWASRAALLLGLGSLDEARENAFEFLDRALDIPDIKDYLLFFRGRAHHIKGEFAEAASLYDSLICLYPGSALAADSLFKKGEALMEAGEYLQARGQFSNFIRQYPKNSSIPAALFKSALNSLYLNEGKEVSEALRRLVVHYPLDNASKIALLILNDLKESGGGAPELSSEEIMTRAGKLFDGARYKESIGELSKIKGAEGELRERILLKTAYAQVRLKSYEQAEKTIKEYLKGQGIKKEAEALSLWGLIALRRNDGDELIKIEKKLARKYPGSRERAGVLYYLGTFYEGKRLKEDSFAYFKKVADEFRGSQHAKDALWSISWIDYREGKYEEAYKTLSLFLESAEGKELTKGLYWSGRSLEKMGRVDDALNAYGKVCEADRDGYYRQIAGDRMLALRSGIRIDAPGAPEAVQEEVIIPEPDEIEERDEENGLSLADTEEGFEKKDLLFLNGHYLAARELITLGLQAQASAEVDLLAKRYSKDDEALKMLAGLFYDSGDYFRALRIYRVYLSGFNKDGKRKDLYAFAFPLKLIDTIKEKAPGNADPYLVAAVMREESHFNPKAVSPVGALGLMQIMPYTARFVAKELKKEGFDSKELFNPELNIELGSWYLTHLAERFDNNLVLTIAGYNAGPDAVARWTLTLPSELDEFIESIPYSETRNYAKKVLKSYGEFLRLSGVDPAGRFNRPEGQF
ncbi:MAG: transglycosylase SLT domain-containing protein [Deltaproteobacteria bacterium]|nr:transglycosylase SLT domain-containing protein [Deltaproteobacteria bacterium]